MSTFHPATSSLANLISTTSTTRFTSAVLIKTRTYVCHGITAHTLWGFHGEHQVNTEKLCQVASFPGGQASPVFCPSVCVQYFSRSSASVYYPEHKPKNKKTGRPGNEASCHVHVLLTRASRFWRCAQFFLSLLSAYWVLSTYFLVVLKISVCAY